MKKFIYIFFILFTICSCVRIDPEVERIEGTVEYFYLDYADGCRCVKMVTFEKNGHKWYCVRGSHDINHHPDCKCNKKEESLFNW